MDDAQDRIDEALDPAQYRRVGERASKGGPQSGSDTDTSDPVESEFLKALNIDSWTPGNELARLEARMEREIEEAVRNEAEYEPKIREIIKNNLANAPGAPRDAGVHETTPAMLRKTCELVLFNGRAEACDGTRTVVNTLPISIVSIGVAMTTYAENGNGTSLGQRLYRHEIRQRTGDPEQEVMNFLARRKGRNALAEDSDDAGPTGMMSRALMSYAERALLTMKSSREWRIGHGNPFPYEIFIGAGNPQIPIRGAEVMTRLFGEHKKAVFVPSNVTDLAVKTIATALRPGEYAILQDTREVLDRYLALDNSDSGYRRPSYAEARKAVERLRDDVAANVVMGVYKATALAPGHIFFAHTDFAHEAALIAMADSALTETRGFPNLIDLADAMCRVIFDNAGINGTVGATLARSGAPFSYLSERTTRS